MPLKKSELYSSIWRMCDELRGGMDASQYKDYVLVLLFVKYVSDKYAGQKDALLDVPKGGRFADMVALKGDKEIGDKLNKIIAKLAKANDLTGVIDVADFNDEDKLGKGKEMVDRLSNLVAIFDSPSLDFSSNRAEGDDLLGDAYEYLMRHFATESGKSKGQFYTPAEVSRVIARVVGVSHAKRTDQTIHDPTCGSGSLLLKAHDEAQHRSGLDLALYGQEMDNATTALARMNMILHDCPTAKIVKDNVLANPHFCSGNSLKTFDFCVANPPFSFKAWTSGFDPAHDSFNRFEFGIPPQKNGDLAFVLHILACLKSTGKAAINLPHGVLFRGGAEAAIRREIIRRGYIKGIIGLPANLFYGTGIPACILVLDKEHAQARKGIFMIDASKGFIKDGNKNRLREQDIHRIVDTFTRKLEVPRYSRMVPVAEISDAKNDFNLNLPRYIDSSEPEDLQDIDAHLRGGIPDRDLDALHAYWEVCPHLRQSLFQSAGRPGYLALQMPIGEVKAAIFGHPEFTAFNTSVTALFRKWCKTNTPRLKDLAVGDHPKALIELISEDLLKTFSKAPLMDAYDVYQHLMDYWAETLQDDVYMIVADGWQAAAKPRLIVDEKSSSTKEKPDLVIGKQKFKTDLISAPLVIARHFASEQATIEKLQADAAAIEQQLQELGEEHCGEDGPLEGLHEEGRTIKRADIVAAVVQFEDLAIEECLPAEHKKIVTTAKSATKAEAWLRTCDESPSSKPVLDALRTPRGKLTLANIRKALRAENDDKSKTSRILADCQKAMDELGAATKSVIEAREAALSKLAEVESERSDEQSIRDLAIVRGYLQLFDLGKKRGEEIKAAQVQLNLDVLQKYSQLTEAEIQTLVVDDKWLATIAAAVQGELDRVSQTLTGRIRQLAERYATPLPQLTDEVATLAARVDGHLKKMGAVWK